MPHFQLRLANLITLSRFVSTALLALFVSVDSVGARVGVAVIAMAIFASDIADGICARKFGSITPGMPGTVFDLVVDDCAIITSAMCLLWIDVLPGWIAFPIVWLRAVMTLTRMLTLVRGEPFAAPRISTKIKGFVYGSTLVTVTATRSLSDFIEIPYKNAFDEFLFAALTISTLIAAFDFLTTNGRTLLTLFVTARPVI